MATTAHADGGSGARWWHADAEADRAENHWRRTFCQVPASAIGTQAERGKRSLRRVVAFFRRRAAAERQLGVELRALLQEPLDDGEEPLEALEEPGASLRRALLELRASAEAACHQQLLLATVLEEQVAEPLAALQDASAAYIRTLRDEIANVDGEFEAASGEHAQAAESARRAAKELREARERQRIALHGIGVPAFELQRLAARVAKCEEERAQAEMTRARAKTRLYNRIIARDEMAMAVSVAYQKAEEERLDQLRSSLQRYAHVERERLRAADKTLTALETRVANVSRAEDVQLFIDNHRDPDNLHFQGKALALLDWQWSKTHASPARTSDGGEVTLKPPLQTSDGLFEARASWEEDQEEGDDGVAVPRPSGDQRAVAGPSSMPSATLGSLIQTPMGAALHQFFVRELRPQGGDTSRQDQRQVAPSDGEPISVRGNETGNEPAAQNGDAAVDAASPRGSALSPRPVEPVFDGEKVVRVACRSAAGRAMFVKCLNQQRSLETRIKDRASFDALAACTNAFLDECVRESDIKAAKTAMILAETFYVARGDSGARATDSSPRDAASDDNDADKEEMPPRRERRESANEALLHSVEEAHPALLQRGAARMYLQEEIKKHTIWKSPSFWEKALLLAIREELLKTPQQCPWEELPSGTSTHDGLPSREEAVSRVHNIVFGQLGSFTLSMLEFEVSAHQIESFVETMSDAHELTEDQRFLLRKSLRDICSALQAPS